MSRPLEPRIWLGLALGLLFASFVPYWMFWGTPAVLLNALMALGAAAFLWANVRGERRLAAFDQALIDAGAPSSTSEAGTSTEPSSRW